jgi:plastocyanin
VLHALVEAAVFRDSSKTAYFIAAGVLVGWAVIVSLIGIRSERFPSSPRQGRLLLAGTAVLVAVAVSMAVVTAKTPPGVHPYETGVVTNGVAPPPTPVSPAPAAPTSGPLAISANPHGLLAFSTTTLSAASSHVTIDFTNKSPLPHNFTIANAKGKVLGATPTFMGGTKTLTVTLPAGTYTYYCSVPGHELAGMKGTLTVR